LLAFPVNYAGLLILVIEGAATASIALALASLYSSLSETSFYLCTSPNR
jgi:hypothetical protein